MRIFCGSCLMLFSTGENGEDTLCMYFIKHFSHPRDLPKSEQEVTERQSIPVSTYVEEERDLKQLSDFLYMRWVFCYWPRSKPTCLVGDSFSG